MAEIIDRKKALAVSPLKVSSTVGASLAFLGLKNSMPLMHGSQGCTAFAKVFFVRHFREPIPLQTTAMDQVSSVMGADDNIVEALKVICEKQKPSVIGLVTTGLAETQGCDIKRAVGDFQKEYPEFKETHVVAVNTPDFTGSFESGFAAALLGIVNTLIGEDTSKVGLRPRQVNILCHANITSSDLEYIIDTLEDFELRPLLIPDLSSSLDGHLEEGSFNPLTTGGLSIDELQMANESIATMAIGTSIKAAAELLHKKTSVPTTYFDSLMGLDEVDKWLITLSELSARPVPNKYLKQRQQLQDAMLDTHFMLSDSRQAVAADSDLLIGFYNVLKQVGAHVVAAVTPSKNAALKNSQLDLICIGDFSDLEDLAKEGKAQLMISNSHGAHTAERLGIPLLRAGFPQYDLIGGFSRCWFGYKGTQQLLFDLANMIVNHHQGIVPYHSVYSQKIESQIAHGRYVITDSHIAQN